MPKPPGRFPRMKMAGASALLAVAIPALAASADPFAGTWEARVAMGSDSYTMRLRCTSASDCETQVIPAGARDPRDPPMAFRSTRPQRDMGPVREALAYALGHRADSAGNAEFAALHKLLSATADAKTRLDACLSLDDSAPEFFVVCSVKGATSMRPVLLFFGSLLGLCGQGFCKYAIYPMTRTR